MNGTVAYHRADGRTVFEVRLPLAAEHDPEAGAVSSPDGGAVAVPAERV
jgi:hypothetical protein